MARENPDPYLVLGVSPTATQAEITHAYRTGYAPITPTPAIHQPQPPTTTSGKSWPPTPCCVTPPAAPTTTAQPPTPPHHHPTAHKGRHLLTVPCRPRPDPHHLPQPTPLQPMSHRHHCGPARCAGTDSCDRTEQLAHNPNHIPPHRGPHEHRHQQRTTNQQ